MKYFIISQPKAGTYLCSNILRNLDIHQSYLHLNLNHYSRYIEYINDQEKEFEKELIHMPLKDSINLIKDNSFAVGHIPYDSTIEHMLKDFKKILVTRKIDDCIYSWGRFSKESRFAKGDFYKNKTNQYKYEKIAEWADKEDVYHITFNDMINKNIKKTNELQLFLFDEIKFLSEEILRKSLNEDSLTKSSIRK
jgi:hypothetical protein